MKNSQKTSQPIYCLPRTKFVSHKLTNNQMMEPKQVQFMMDDW
jgi:hypothetical protein